MQESTIGQLLTTEDELGNRQGNLRSVGQEGDAR